VSGSGRRTVVPSTAGHVAITVVIVAVVASTAVAAVVVITTSVSYTQHHDSNVAIARSRQLHTEIIIQTSGT